MISRTPDQALHDRGALPHRMESNNDRQGYGNPAEDGLPEHRAHRRARKLRPTERPGNQAKGDVMGKEVRQQLGVYEVQGQPGAYQELNEGTLGA